MDRCAPGKHGAARGFPAHGDVGVYPALADVQPNLWAAAHAINSGGNTTTQLAGMVIAIAGTVATNALTAFCAGPTHRRLSSDLDPVLMRKLISCDRWRTVAAVLALVGAVLLATG
jgi:hypothetical protein